MTFEKGTQGPILQIIQFSEADGSDGQTERGLYWTWTTEGLASRLRVLLSLLKKESSFKTRAIRCLRQKFGASPPLRLSENISIYGSIAVQDDLLSYALSECRNTIVIYVHK